MSYCLKTHIESCVEKGEDFTASTLRQIKIHLRKDYYKWPNSTRARLAMLRKKWLNERDECPQFSNDYQYWWSKLVTLDNVTMLINKELDNG